MSTDQTFDPPTPHPPTPTPIVSRFQPEPVLPPDVLQQLKATPSAKSGFAWSAELEIGDGRTGWTRGFLFHFLYEGPVKWLSVRVVGLDVAGKRSFDGCGFRSGCPVLSAHGCDTVNHAVITHAQGRLHGHGAHGHTHTHTRRHAYAYTDDHVYMRFLALSHRKLLFFFGVATSQKIPW